MNYEILIFMDGKQEAFYKDAMAEYEKRLTRYCKLKVRYLKKEKDIWKLFACGEDVFVLTPGKEMKSSEGLSAWIGEQENSGVKKLMFLIAGQKVLKERYEELSNDPKIHFVSLSHFEMNVYLEGVILEEQIYRAYRILNNHPYHK